MPQLDLGSVLGPQGPKGDPGNQGTVGPRGPQGEQGDAGKDATINGVNALTIETGDGLEATMTGSAYNLKLTDNTLNAVRVVPTFTRPNLLDNWYFGRPVDQRGGKIVQQGKMAYRDAACTIEAGGVSETAMTVTKVSDTVYTFKGGDGSQYYVKAADVVRGYVPAWNGYSIDRWSVESDSEVVITFVNGGIRVKNTSNVERQFKQILPIDLNLAGSMITISTLVGDVIGQIGYVLTQVSDPYKNSAACTITKNGLFSASGSVFTGQQKVTFALSPGAELTILAAKLELGPTQTLAHQDAAGSWVLNEVPKGGDELRECQRYHFNSKSAQNSAFLMRATSSSYLFGTCTFPVTMRTTPSVQLLSYRDPSTGTVITAGGVVSQITSDGFCVVYDAEKFTAGSIYQVNFSASADL